MEKTKKCSVGKLLNCDKIDCCRKIAKKWGTIEDVRQLSENQKDLLLFRANLTIDSVTSVCPYHKKYFCIDNPSFFYGRNRNCCNPFNLHGPGRKGDSFTSIKPS